jgi:bacterial/archaeal transporter family protein
MTTNSWPLRSLLSAPFGGATGVWRKSASRGVNSNLATAIRTTVVLMFTWALAAQAISPAAFAALSHRTTELGYFSCCHP